MKSYWQNYIDGAWVDGGARRIDVINPGTGEKLAEQALADASDVDRAVMAAQRVYQSGRRLICALSRAGAWCKQWGAICSSISMSLRRF